MRSIPRASSSAKPSRRRLGVAVTAGLAAVAAIALASSPAAAGPSASPSTSASTSASASASAASTDSGVVPGSKTFTLGYLGDMDSANPYSGQLTLSYEIYGDVYDTPDGTGLRDYIHVEDLAAAHVVGVARLAAGPTTGAVYNVGTGRGYSVLEVIDRIGAVTGQPVEYRIGPRRPGDPPSVIADAGLIRRELGWQARYDLADMIESTWRAWSAVPAG